MCIPVGVEFKCDHFWVGYKPCPEVGGQCKIMLEGRPLNPKYTQEVHHNFGKYRAWARDYATFLKIPRDCGPGCCKRRLDFFISRTNDPNWLQKVRPCIARCLEDFSQGIGMSNAMRLEMGISQMPDGVHFAVSNLSGEVVQRREAKAQAECQVYNNVVAAGRGLVFSSSTRPSYEQFLHLRRWVLSDLNKRVTDSRLRPLPDVKAQFDYSVNIGAIDSEAGFGKAMMLQGMEALRDAWEKLPGMRLESGAIAPATAAPPVQPTTSTPSATPSASQPFRHAENVLRDAGAHAAGLHQVRQLQRLNETLDEWWNNAMKWSGWTIEEKILLLGRYQEAQQKIEDRLQTIWSYAAEHRGPFGNTVEFFMAPTKGYRQSSGSESQARDVNRRGYQRDRTDKQARKNMQ